jgi:hypothetical protein
MHAVCCSSAHTPSVPTYIQSWTPSKNDGDWCILSTKAPKHVHAIDMLQRLHAAIKCLPLPGQVRCRRTGICVAMATPVKFMLRTRNATATVTADAQLQTSTSAVPVPAGLTAQAHAFTWRRMRHSQRASPHARAAVSVPLAGVVVAVAAHVRGAPAEPAGHVAAVPAVRLMVSNHAQSQHTLQLGRI